MMADAPSSISRPPFWGTVSRKCKEEEEEWIG